MDLNKLTSEAQNNLIASLIRFGNKPALKHKQALYALNRTFTGMASGKLQGRVAFGLPTGTGKTRAIVEWATQVYKMNLPFSLAVSASRIEALCTLKQDMVDNGIPDASIGLLYDGKHAGLPPTDENEEKPFMLITHQRIRANEKNLRQYNSYKGKDRSLLVYDESLLISEVQSHKLQDLKGALLWASQTYADKDQHADMLKYFAQCYDCLLAAEAEYKQSPDSVKLFSLPQVNPKDVLLWQLQHLNQRDIDTTLRNFLDLANTELRMLRHGDNTIVHYRIVIPPLLKNIVVLDASYPVRLLCHYDNGIKDAEKLDECKVLSGTRFADLKRFDKVTLYRLKGYGGRTTVHREFAGDKRMVKEVVKVLATIPKDEAVLMYVYKMNQKRSLNCTRILADEIEAAGLDTWDSKRECFKGVTPEGKPRLIIQTWGNETSLNCYVHCTHVFLVGILHRDEAELAGAYLGQIQDLTAPVSSEQTKDIQMSEKTHLAYQALSRGSCRVIDGDQARAMKGYVVEYYDRFEPELTAIMPGVKWETWKPYFLPDTKGVQAEWVRKVADYMEGFKKWGISSRKLKDVVGAEQVSKRTWARVVQSFIDRSRGAWIMKGYSLVKSSGQSYGFRVEGANGANPS